MFRSGLVTRPLSSALDTACPWVPHVLQQRSRRQRGMIGAALVQPHLHGVQLVLHRGAVPLLLLLLLLLLLRWRLVRGRPVVEAGRGDGTQAELRQVAHPLGMRHGERLSNES